MTRKTLEVNSSCEQNYWTQDLTIIKMWLYHQDKLIGMRVAYCPFVIWLYNVYLMSPPCYLYILYIRTMLWLLSPVIPTTHDKQNDVNWNLLINRLLLTSFPSALQDNCSRLFALLLCSSYNPYLSRSKNVSQISPSTINLCHRRPILS